MTGTTTNAPDRIEEAVIGASLIAGTANVIMQLARPGVGYGVVESTVESGQVFRHPVKRARTTLTYLAVAMLGSEQERAQYRRAVNQSHGPVCSDESSPVSYNAFDPQLQLWVAACLYKGVVDTNEAFGFQPDPVTAEQRYQQGSALGTTLQVPRDMWPADLAAFEEYWNSSVEKVSIDDTVRDYLYKLTMLGFTPRLARLLFGPLNRFFTTGFLPPRFREEMRLSWSAAQQRRFDALMSLNGRLIRVLPPMVRKFPFNALLWDLRRRIRKGRALV